MRSVQHGLSNQAFLLRIGIAQRVISGGSTGCHISGARWRGCSPVNNSRVTTNPRSVVLECQLLLGFPQLKLRINLSKTRSQYCDLLFLRLELGLKAVLLLGDRRLQFLNFTMFLEKLIE